MQIATQSVMLVFKLFQTVCMQERLAVHKVAAGNAPTHTLKELLITSSVDMEAVTDTNITALCTMYVAQSYICKLDF